MNNIRLIQGDITTARADAIVNAANPFMLGGGGVDGAIHRAAGPALLKECKRIPPMRGIRCPVGEARITGAGNLHAQFVIHTVGPRYDIDPDPEALLAASYRSSLDLAIAHNCRSLAFPAISCGIYGYPLDQAAAIAVEICGRGAYRALDICFFLFGKSIMEAWSEALGRQEHHGKPAKDRT